MDFLWIFGPLGSSPTSVHDGLKFSLDSSMLKRFIYTRLICSRWFNFSYFTFLLEFWLNWVEHHTLFTFEFHQLSLVITLFGPISIWMCPDCSANYNLAPHIKIFIFSLNPQSLYSWSINKASSIYWQLNYMMPGKITGCKLWKTHTMTR